MAIDPENPVVRLCAKGIEEEMSGNMASAAALYAQAWEQKTTDYEAAIAAHYMARLQSTAEEVLHWNFLALLHAEKVSDEEIQAFYPSLYLNVGKAYEDLGNAAETIKNYELGIKKTHLLPDDPLGNLTREALEQGLGRVKK